MSTLMELAERGILPDTMIRLGIRLLDRVRLRTEARPGIETELQAKQDFLARMRQSPVALVPEMANRQHYEVPPEFFQKVLGKNLKDVVVYTSRQLITGPDAESSLSIGRGVSEGLVALVQAISTRPRYLLAKGGITSSDVATRGLNVRRAGVLGQILPGVPVWRLGPESRHPGLDYILFPGNVGDRQSLVKIVEMLRE